MTSTRDELIALIEPGVIPQEKIDDALTLTGVKPDGGAWRSFVDRLMLTVGGLALAIAVMFFVAYNWSDLGKFAKFGMVELLMATAILAYWKFGAQSVAGRISLLVASILLGVLLALYGQTYQTGADPWQLFFNWALLMLPWALVARFPAIWVVWLALINLSLVLYFMTFRGVLGILFRSPLDLLWLIVGINIAALLAWEYLALTRTWLNERWAARLIALAGGTGITWLALWSIFDYREAGFLPALAWLLWTAGLYFTYKFLRRDLFMLAGLCLSGIVIVNSYLIKSILSEGNPGSFLLIAIVIIGMAAASAVWLRNVNRAWQS